MPNTKNFAHEIKATPELLHEHLFGPKPGAEAIIARLNGNPVGFALFFSTFSTFHGRPGIWLEDLFVLAEHRRKGVGIGAVPPRRLHRRRATIAAGSNGPASTGTNPLSISTAKSVLSPWTNGPPSASSSIPHPFKNSRVARHEPLRFHSHHRWRRHARHRAHRCPQIPIPPPLALGRGELDIADSTAVARAFTIHKPTLVLNCAAHTKVDQCEIEPHKADLINGYAVGELAAHCRAPAPSSSTSAPISSSTAHHRRPYRTDDPTNPLAPTADPNFWAKPNFVKMPPSAGSSFAPPGSTAATAPTSPAPWSPPPRTGKTLRVVNDQFGSPTYTIDLAQAIVALLDSNAHGLWHLTNAGHTTWYDFAKAALAQFGIDSKVDPVSSSEWAQMRPQHRRPPVL